MNLTEALTMVLAGTWTDTNGRVRPFTEAQRGGVAAGSCTEINGDLASALAAAAFDVSLVDLQRERWESHVVVQVTTDDGPLWIDAAWAQFGGAVSRMGAPWPVVMPRDGYLEWSGFRFINEEKITNERNN